MKKIIFCCLTLLMLSCDNGYQSSEYTSLKKEIRALKDSLQDFQDYYYHFKGVKTIADSEDTLFKVNKEYTFNCYMAAYQMMFRGNLLDLRIKGKSSNGNSLKFKKVNGDIKMQYIPKISGIDTLKLDYRFKGNDSINWMSFPMNLEILVLENGGSR